jgi:hypothetical protein
MACEGCGASPADFFSPTGDSLCRRCFYAGEQERLDHEAQASLEAELPKGLKYDDRPRTPSGLILSGLGITALGLLVAGAVFWLSGGIEFWALGVSGFGTMMVVRGVTQARAS